MGVHIIRMYVFEINVHSTSMALTYTYLLAGHMVHRKNAASVPYPMWVLSMYSHLLVQLKRNAKTSGARGSFTGAKLSSSIALVGNEKQTRHTKCLYTLCLIPLLVRFNYVTFDNIFNNAPENKPNELYKSRKTNDLIDWNIESRMSQWKTTTIWNRAERRNIRQIETYW